jgi:hypothetical protein
MHHHIVFLSILDDTYHESVDHNDLVCYFLRVALCDSLDDTYVVHEPVDFRVVSNMDDSFTDTSDMDNHRLGNIF